MISRGRRVEGNTGNGPFEKRIGITYHKALSSLRAAPLDGRQECARGTVDPVQSVPLRGEIHQLAKWRISTVMLSQELPQRSFRSSEQPWLAWLFLPVRFSLVTTHYTLKRRVSYGRISRHFSGLALCGTSEH